MKSMARIFLALGLLLGSSTGFARDAARYYMVMFAAQTPENMARSSHSFATFVKEERGRLTEELTISWLPQQGYFGPDYTMPPLRIVPGRNYTLDQTMAISPRRHTSFWGPYEITPSLYARAQARVAYLNRSLTSYKMMNLARGGLRDAPLQNQPGGAINCIMAVSDIGGYLDTGTSWGIDASGKVLMFLARDVLDDLRTTVPHPEIADAMDLYRRIGR